jgi:hypothetical protein
VFGATLLMLAPLLLLGWRLLEESPSQTRIVQILFVGLAALTVPHMVVVGDYRSPVALLPCSCR